jgi:hypothetical protein
VLQRPLPPKEFVKQCLKCGRIKTFKTDKTHNRCGPSCIIHRGWATVSNTVPVGTSVPAGPRLVATPVAPRKRPRPSPSPINHDMPPPKAPKAKAVAPPVDDDDDDDESSNEWDPFDIGVPLTQPRLSPEEEEAESGPPPAPRDSMGQIRQRFHDETMKPFIQEVADAYTSEIQHTHTFDFTLPPSDFEGKLGCDAALEAIARLITYLWTTYSIDAISVDGMHEMVGGSNCIHRMWLCNAAVRAGWLRDTSRKLLRFPTLHQPDCSDEDSAESEEF